jgi:hypothetical protein
LIEQPERVTVESVMRSPRCTIVCWLAAGCLTVPLRADPSAPRLSPRTQNAVRALLPKFDASQATLPQPATATAENPSGPIEKDGVVIFPDYTVIEKKVAEPRPDDWVQSDAITRREIRRLEADMTDLELLLNRWHIPLLSAPFSARARSRYESQRFRSEFTRFLDLAKAVETLDRRAAQELREALDFRKLPKEGRK